MADEAPGFERVVWAEVLRPAVRNRLIPQLRLYQERPLSVACRDRIPDAVALIAKVRILGGVSLNGDALIGGSLVKTARQQAVVLDVFHGIENRGRHVISGVSAHLFVDALV